MFGILFCMGFWLVVIAAGPKGNAASLGLALTAMVVAGGMIITERSAA